MTQRDNHRLLPTRKETRSPRKGFWVMVGESTPNAVEESATHQEAVRSLLSSWGNDSINQLINQSINPTVDESVSNVAVHAYTTHI